MKVYALIQDWKVHEIISVEGGSPTISERYHPDLVSSMVEITRLIPQPQVGWLLNPQDGRLYEALGIKVTPVVEF